MVSPDPERSDDPPGARWRRRSHRSARARPAPRPPRLRGAPPRRPWPRQERGDPERLGLGWAKDIAGALAFLKTREEVDPQRIGALGLSTGADVLVQLAAQRQDLHAVVADGTVAGSFEDGQRVNGISAITPFMAMDSRLFR